MNAEIFYKKIVNSLKQKKNGATIADICASTALPLATVAEFLPKAADEYSGHLRVTESGEIQYYFPNGFTSRYKGFGAVLKKATDKAAGFLKKSLVLLFKIWIMVMLIGYFLLFIALALATVFLQLTAKSGSKRSGSGRGGGVNFSVFNLVWRIWFYNELTRPSGNRNRNYRNSGDKERKLPMHKAIFSFVFGEEDPNKDWGEKTDKSIIGFIQANRGVISLSEYMVFTGENILDAEENIMSFCSRFGGSPEVTEEGIIVYRFDKLLLQSNTNKITEPAALLKKLKTFSANSKKTNWCFIAINTVNLWFGSYFLYQSFAVGKIIFDPVQPVVQGFYSSVYYFFSFILSEPHNFIRIILGIIPLVFSLFFWVIPAIRGLSEKKENKKNKLSNFKRFCFNKILCTPKNIDVDSLIPGSNDFFPDDPAAAAEKVINEVGSFSVPEIAAKENGKMLYSFNELEREKQEVKKYRDSIDTSKLQIGNTVFDSNS